MLAPKPVIIEGGSMCEGILCCEALTCNRLTIDVPYHYVRRNPSLSAHLRRFAANSVGAWF